VTGSQDHLREGAVRSALDRLSERERTKLEGQPRDHERKEARAGRRHHLERAGEGAEGDDGDREVLPDAVERLGADTSEEDIGERAQVDPLDRDLRAGRAAEVGSNSDEADRVGLAKPSAKST